MIEGIGERRLTMLLDSFGTLEHAWNSGYHELLQVPGFGRKLATSFIDQRKKIYPAQEIDWAQKNDATILTHYDHNYPDWLREIGTIPPVIYCAGKLPSVAGIAIVGSRKPTHSGRHQAYNFSRSLASEGLPIISGLARGIDTQAHLGALSVESGRTIAVLGSPLSHIYPPENRRLSEKIKSTGCLISEFSSKSGTKPGNFPRRNRLISALARGVLVVEAGEKSGTLSTVDWALEQGKEVWAIPGEIHHPLRKGTNKLIKQGATLVDSPTDIIQDSSGFYGALPHIQLDQSSQLVLKYYRQGLSAEEIVDKTELAVQEIQSLLTILEIEGLMN